MNKTPVVVAAMLLCFCTCIPARADTSSGELRFRELELHLFTAPGHPKEGGLVAVYAGRDASLKAILLLTHLEVVEARREDWTGVGVQALLECCDFLYRLVKIYAEQK